VWVAASAGTGKTKVLTDRVLRLLLAGTPPHRLLCLTFTKAAAAEMANRLAARLARWATAEDAALADDLAELTGQWPDAATMTAARRLFAQVLDVPGGMRIETIHAFCQSLLRRFPLEAGLAPHFQVMDERDAGEMLADAREGLLSAARLEEDSPVAAALAGVTRAVHEGAFADLIAELAGQRGRLRRLIERSGSLARLLERIAGRLAVRLGETAETVIGAACAEDAFDAAGCRRAIAALGAGKPDDVKRAALMAPWLADLSARPTLFDAWRSALLTNDDTVRKRLCSNEVEAAHSGVRAVLVTEADRIAAVVDRLKAVATVAATADLLTLGDALLASYRRRKAASAMLDYDDLILNTIALLERPGLSAWVLYKLDGGLDHVLIDEAQDTNPDQWAVVRALTAEFFAGRGSRDEAVRTVFAVGDVKQSIYSFQHADPREFDAMRRRLAAAVPAARGRWDEVALDLSFRSAPAVLQAVDLVANGPGRDGVVAPDETVHHLAFRSGAGGFVEVWPPLVPRPTDEPEPWKPPVERIKADNPRSRLARLVAWRIRTLIDGGQPLASTGGPIGPGDIMVLVRRRNAFVDELVRELKGLAVEVAGADRMVLTEQLAVMDLIALANVLLLPDDDLTLATVLKSPLVGLSEDELFSLAHGRPGSLWEALRQRADERPYAAAWTWLADLFDRADRVPPHDLFAHVLTLGGKARLLARLGSEAEDPLDEFIGLTLTYERLHPPSLQGFLRWLEEGAVEIKRDLEQGGGAVRILTVHGAKGLQAPVVFLPDTMQVPKRPPRLLWLDDGDGDELPIWPPRAADQDAACRAARDAAAKARDREYRRLLYVAMTRAEDRLYLCGWQTRQAPPADCWYGLVRDALAAVAEAADDPFLAARPEANGCRVLRLSSAQDDALRPAPAARSLPGPAGPLPAWTRRAVPVEPPLPRPLMPSRPDSDEPPVRSPLGIDDGARFRRGRLIHRLLETLPDLAAERRIRAMARFLGRPAWGLSYAEQAEIAGEVTAVLADPVFAAIFGIGSRAEVPLVGMVGEKVISGQVDRLLVTDREVLIVDYKTDRPPPSAASNVAPLYLRQMAAYRAALACLYPGRAVRCALLWTDGPRLMPLDPTLLDDALAGLADRRSRPAPP
jgi:ATP-dependent helicase/nuclease subunit A